MLLSLTPRLINNPYLVRNSFVKIAYTDDKGSASFFIMSSYLCGTLDNNLSAKFWSDVTNQICRQPWTSCSRLHISPLLTALMRISLLCWPNHLTPNGTRTQWYTHKELVCKCDTLSCHWRARSMSLCVASS